MLMSVSLQQSLFAIDKLAAEGEVDAMVHTVASTKKTAKRKGLKANYAQKEEAFAGKRLLVGKREAPAGQILAICDPDAHYTERLGRYLKEHLSVPFEIREYTSVEALLQSRTKAEPTILLVAGAMTAELADRHPEVFESVIVLEEQASAGRQEEDDALGLKVTRMGRYTSAERIVGTVLDHCMSLSTVVGMHGRQDDSGLRILGLYTPLTRCLQTTTALTMAKILAEKEKTLYLNFEPFAVLEPFAETEPEYDLSDLLYFFACYPDKIPLYLEKVKMTSDDLHYIPPARSFLELKNVEPQKWQNLFAGIRNFTDYRYVILDLSGHLDGLLDILQLCDRVYTIEREDTLSVRRLNRYKELLTNTGCGAIWDRTECLKLPLYERLPKRIEEYRVGQLAGHIRQILTPEMLANEHKESA